MEKINYYLVIEKRLGDNNLVDINKLDICDTFVGNDIADIDTFTSRFTVEEIKDSIIRSNIVQNDYLDGTLKVISDAKHNLPILSKDTFLSIIDFQNSGLEMENNFKNKLFGTYKKIVEQLFTDTDFIKTMLERFKEVLRNNNKEEMFKYIAELPYYKGRMIYFIIFDEIQRKKEENLRKLEKLNDVA